MTEFELTSLIYDLFRDMDAMIQFWMTATFAVVVAVFIGRRQLTRGMLRVIVVLYLIASAVSALRWWTFLDRTLYYREQLRSAGFADIPRVPEVITSITALIVAMFLLGAIAALVFVLRRPPGRADLADLADPAERTGLTAQVPDDYAN